MASDWPWKLWVVLVTLGAVSVFCSKRRRKFRPAGKSINQYICTLYSGKYRKISSLECSPIGTTCPMSDGVLRLERGCELKDLHQGQRGLSPYTQESSSFENYSSAFAMEQRRRTKLTNAGVVIQETRNTVVIPPGPRKPNYQSQGCVGQTRKTNFHRPGVQETQKTTFHRPGVQETRKTVNLPPGSVIKETRTIVLPKGSKLQETQRTFTRPPGPKIQETQRTFHRPRGCVTQTTPRPFHRPQGAVMTTSTTTTTIQLPPGSRVQQTHRTVQHNPKPGVQQVFFLPSCRKY